MPDYTVRVGGKTITIRSKEPMSKDDLAEAIDTMDTGTPTDTKKAAGQATAHHDVASRTPPNQNNSTNQRQKQPPKSSTPAIKSNQSSKPAPVASIISPFALRDAKGEMAHTTIGPPHPTPEPNLLQKALGGLSAVMGYPKALISASTLGLHHDLNTGGGQLPASPGGTRLDEANVQRLLKMNPFQRAAALQGENPADPLMGRPYQQAVRDTATKAQYGVPDPVIRFTTGIATDPVTYVFGPVGELLPNSIRTAIEGAFGAQAIAGGAGSLSHGIKTKDRAEIIDGVLDMAMGGLTASHMKGQALASAKADLIAARVVDHAADSKPGLPERLASRYGVPVGVLKQAIQRHAVKAGHSRSSVEALVASHAPPAEKSKLQPKWVTPKEAVDKRSRAAARRPVVKPVVAPAKEQATPAPARPAEATVAPAKGKRPATSKKAVETPSVSTEKPAEAAPKPEPDKRAAKPNPAPVESPKSKAQEIVDRYQPEENRLRAEKGQVRQRLRQARTPLEEWDNDPEYARIQKAQLELRNKKDAEFDALTPDNILPGNRGTEGEERSGDNATQAGVQPENPPAERVGDDKGGPQAKSRSSRRVQPATEVQAQGKAEGVAPQVSKVRVAEGKAFLPNSAGGEHEVALPQNPAERTAMIRRLQGAQEFSDWIKSQPKGKVYTKASDLYQAYKMQNPKITREQFGQMLHDLSLHPEWEVVRSASDPNGSGVFKGVDSTGIERPLIGVRPKETVKPAPEPVLNDTQKKMRVQSLTQSIDLWDNTAQARKRYAENADTPEEKAKWEKEAQFYEERIAQARKEIAGLQGNDKSAPAPTPAHLTAKEANTIGMHLPQSHPWEQQYLTAKKPVPITPEQAEHLRSILDKVKGLDKDQLPNLYPKDAKPSSAPSSRPKGGAPPPSAPIVGGIPEIKGGSGKPAAPKLPIFTRPTKAGIKSGIGEITRRLSNFLNRGLTGIERHARATDDPRLLRAARKEAGSEGQANAIAYHTMPLIRKALGNSDAKVQQFFHYLAEGSLRGARQRWNDLHDQVLALRPDQLADPKLVTKYIDILERLEGRRRDEAAIDFDRDPEDYNTPGDRIVDPAANDRTHFAPGLARRARNLLANGAYDEMRILMAGAFDEAYNTVGVMADFDPARVGTGAEDFDTFGNKPEIQAAMKLYKENIGDPLGAAYRANKGEPSHYLGPLETWFPLVPFREDGTSGHPMQAPRAPFHNVPNPNAKFKTGLADHYDTSVPVILDRIRYYLKRNNRGALVNTLRDIGLAQDLPPGTDFESAPKTIRVNGMDIPAVMKPWRGSTKVVTDGKVHFTPGRNMLVARFAADELEPQLQNGEYEPKGLFSYITQAAITGPTSGIFHNWNLASSLVSGTPFIGKGLGKIPGSIPGLKMATAITSGLSIDPASPSRAADIRLLGELGLLHPKTGTVTASADFADQTGMKKAPTAAMLYGVHGTELRTRLALLDAARAAADEAGVAATPEDIYNFVSQAGIYAHGLDSRVERVLKRAQLAPFITAGKTQVGLGARALAGTTPLPQGAKFSAKVKLRARQQISSGIVGATALWFAAYKSYTGHLPTKDDKFNEIPIKPEDRNSKSGQMLFGKGTNPVKVSLDIANPALARGMHALGAKAVIDGVAAGHKPDAIISAASKDILNGFASPVTTAPPVRFGTEAILGKEPYLTSWRGPIKGRVDPQLIDAVPQEEMSSHRLMEQWLNAALNLNPYSQFAGQVTGIGYRREDRKDDDAATVALKTARDLLLPRAVPFSPPPHVKKSRGRGHSLLPAPPAAPRVRLPRLP